MPDAIRIIGGTAVFTLYLAARAEFPYFKDSRSRSPALRKVVELAVFHSGEECADFICTVQLHIANATCELRHACSGSWTWPGRDTGFDGDLALSQNSFLSWSISRIRSRSRS